MEEKIKLDLKDKKILYELDKNSRQSLTQLGKKIGLSKEATHYRLNNLIKKGIILNFHTVPATYRLGQISYKIYLKLHDITKREYQELVDYLKGNKDIFWIGESRGRWDLIFGIWAKSIEDFFEIHDQVLEKFSEHLQQKELSTSRENIQYNRRWLHNPNKQTKTFDFGEKEKQLDLEQKDQKILNILVKNSREKIIDIAEKTNLSVDIVRYRIKKMEQDKVIRGYKCLYNVKALGYTTCKAFIYFKNITNEKKQKFLEFCQNHPNCINVVTTFAPWDLEIMFETPSYESYFEIIEEFKDKFSSIIKFYESVLITSEPKQVFKR